MQANLASVHAVFERLRADGVRIDQPLRWGFVFSDAERLPLERIFAELEGYEYHLESLRALEDGTGWVLHVTKTEVLAPDKLHRRNVSFNELAEYCEAALYDGWEVDVPRT